MKLIEKMAKHEALRQDFVNHDTPQTSCIGGTAFHAGYVAGFRAAREMILDLDNCGQECETDWNAIAHIGESEVEEKSCGAI